MWFIRSRVVGWCEDCYRYFEVFIEVFIGYCLFILGVCIFCDLIILFWVYSKGKKGFFEFLEFIVI